ncbi:polysaccharide biosynthesis protein [Rossellomorea aquimaris]|uniref:putative polysaccharide biosynthesis protein n=1 Tax=Rossellomorea aquimaris TaxID=189382 RepID=UPI001CD57B48|nr:polysaccharide biosynthesis protein [Rossellomorea aquimaris]MCA1057266.1 polysaccharide biosynthesis protein [Rossellomorea aquimaris]
MRKQYSSKQFLKGAMVLTLAALVTKILSAVYRVPFQNIVGDVGFYIYQQVYPFYGIALALSTYGFPVIISKLVAEKLEHDDEEGAKDVALTSFFFLCIIGLIWFMLIYFSAGMIARWMGDAKLTPLIKLISLSFLLLPPLSVLRGYYQGKENMIPTAVSQVAEQSVRVVTILLFAIVLVGKDHSLYTVGRGALFGSITGGIAALLVLLFYMALKKEMALSSGIFTFPEEYLSIWKRLLKDGTAICVSAMLLILFQFIDSMNLYALLTSSGMEETVAKKWKGIYDRGQPFVQLGNVVATSISLTIVPLVTSAYIGKKESLVREYSQLSLKISIIIGSAASLGLINLIVPTNTMLFENADGSGVIAVFCVSILFSCMILTFSGILQGIGSIYYPAICIMIGVILKYAGNATLVPLFGTMGASLATILALLVISILLIVKIKKVFLIRLIDASFYKTLLISGAAMTAVLQGLMFIYGTVVATGLPEREMAAVFSLGGVVIGGSVFILLLLRGRILTEEEIGFLPFGSKMVRLMKKVQS